MKREYNFGWEIPKLACRRIDPEFAQEGARRIRVSLRDSLIRAYEQGVIPFDELAPERVYELLRTNPKTNSQTDKD